ncbi:hypothetical protein HJG60_008394 [Phyllostomus discolor]|uniref:Uncharacterized protein n=1 Tax=Phyllostomus discolor TaxID=89673 RepID=A0A833Z448_9CHIR|nr:hypothetical protein HJG60_008394 [Phyllostomus discolor]
MPRRLQKGWWRRIGPGRGRGAVPEAEGDAVGTAGAQTWDRFPRCLCRGCRRSGSAWRLPQRPSGGPACDVCLPALCPRVVHRPDLEERRLICSLGRWEYLGPGRTGWLRVTQVASDGASLLSHCPLIFANTVSGANIPPKTPCHQACRSPCPPHLFRSAPFLSSPPPTRPPTYAPLHSSSDVTDLLFVDWLWAWARACRGKRGLGAHGRA